MALNRVFDEADQISLPVPPGTESGDPLVIGALPCVALVDRRTDGNATVDCDGAYAFDVNGKDKDGNAAIGEGDVLYLQNDDSIDADVGGDRFGYAVLPVDSGATTNIPVKIGF